MHEAPYEEPPSTGNFELEMRRTEFNAFHTMTGHIPRMDFHI